MNLRRSTASRTLLLAAESTLIRAALGCLIDGFEGVSVIGEAGSAREAAALAKRRRPDIVVLAGDAVAEAAREIRRGNARTRIVIVTVGLGGNGSAAGPDIDVLPASASARDLERKLLPAPAANGNGRALTPRQYQVLKRVPEGCGVKEIARQLGISVKTAETHRAQLMKRLKIYDLAGLIRYALREKITRL